MWLGWSMESAAHGWVLSSSSWLASPWPFPSESNGLCSVLLQPEVKGMSESSYSLCFESFAQLCSPPAHFQTEPAKVGARGMWLIGESQCLCNSCHHWALGFLLHPIWHKWPLSKGTALSSHCYKCIQILLGCNPSLAACKRDSAVLPLVLCACPCLIAPLSPNLWSWRMGQTNLLILWKSGLVFTRAWAGWQLNFVRLLSCPNWPVAALLGKLWECVAETWGFSPVERKGLFFLRTNCRPALTSPWSRAWQQCLSFLCKGLEHRAHPHKEMLALNNISKVEMISFFLRLIWVFLWLLFMGNSCLYATYQAIQITAWKSSLFASPPVSILTHCLYKTGISVQIFCR